ncbi:MAG: YiiX/YebB-like N1pC/P60 family cysteine hydrolase [candidate division Zixibacteria bacterium]|nr:YiiX/YebB-like N1pC/P60 family cysteine hydrolase [candidate division Zixibacteria bacterium]
MIKKLNIIPIVIIALILISQGALGGKGKGGSSEPKYYSFEDLRGYLRDDETFHFENANKPTNALLSFGYLLTYPACASTNKKINSAIKSSPSNYKINSSRISCNWREGQKSPFNWKGYRNDLSIGDLIFTRGDDKMNNLVKFFSNWTHVVIVTDPTRNKILDSTLSDGVQEHSVPDKWEGFGYYTCKRVDMPTQLKRYYVVAGSNKYSKKPYLPRFETSDILLWNFVYKWSDKDDQSSMYCSKLVYNVFKPFIILDSRRTSVAENSLLRDKAPGYYAFSWIGISPDNIYYSMSLGPDFDFSNNIWTL